MSRYISLLFALPGNFRQQQRAEESQLPALVCWDPWAPGAGFGAAPAPAEPTSPPPAPAPHPGAARSRDTAPTGRALAATPGTSFSTCHFCGSAAEQDGRGKIVHVCLGPPPRGPLSQIRTGWVTEQNVSPAK